MPISPRAKYCLSVIIDIEGGYSPAKPSDPGGETKFGISKRQYPNVDIKNLTMEGAIQILYKDYWQVVRGDELRPPMDLVVCDGAINQGPQTAIRLLQKVCGVPQDGVVGNKTIAFTKPALLNEYLAERGILYAHTANFGTNGLGWFKRLFKLKDR